MPPRYDGGKVAAILARPPQSLLSQVRSIIKASNLKIEWARLKAEKAELKEEVAAMDQNLKEVSYRWEVLRKRSAESKAVITEDVRTAFVSRLSNLDESRRFKLARLDQIGLRQTAIETESSGLSLPTDCRMVVDLLLKPINGHNGSAKNGKLNRQEIDLLFQGLRNGSYAESKIANWLIKLIRAVSSLSPESLQDNLDPNELTFLLFFICAYQRN